MAHRKLSKKNIEDETFAKVRGPRIIRPKFGPGKGHKLKPLVNPPVFNGDEGIQNIQRLSFHANRKFHLASTATSEKKIVLLTEGLDKLEYQWNNLERKENQFGTAVRKFNRFIKENLMKRERFAQSIERSQEQFGKYNAETVKMKQKIVHLQQNLEEMKTEIKRHDIYEDFLWTAVAASGEFKTVYAFVTRFKVLIDTLDESTALFIQNKSLLLFLLRQLNVKMYKEKSVVDELMNRLCKLGLDLNEVTAKNLVNEKVVCDVHGQAAKKLSEVHRSLELMNQLYQFVCSREKKKVLHHTGDYENQLMVIRRALKNFRRVFRVCNAGTQLKE